MAVLEHILGRLTLDRVTVNLLCTNELFFLVWKQSTWDGPLYIEELQVIEMKLCFFEDRFCLSTQCRPRRNAALCGISSGSSLFVKELI